MATLTTTGRVSLLNFVAGVALLASLFPMTGKLPAKPAGYRTAIELLDKRFGGFGPGAMINPVTRV